MEKFIQEFQSTLLKLKFDVSEILRFLMACIKHDVIALIYQR